MKPERMVLRRRILIIDPQVAFCAPEGSLARSFGAAELREITACLTRLDAWLGEYPRPEEILLVRSEYHPGQFTAGDLDHPFAMACAPGSVDGEWHLSPRAIAGKRVFTKQTQSAAAVPELLAELSELEEVVLAGFLTTSCVRKTALDLRAALPASVKLSVLRDLTASRASSYVARDGKRSRHAAALAEMRQAGCREAPLPAATHSRQWVYKICRHPEWQSAVAAGVYRGSRDDARDGFIHFSLAHQVAATARKYFAGQADLVLVAIEASALGAALRYEASRGGDEFPHLYSALSPQLATWVKPLPWNGTAHVFPDELGSLFDPLMAAQ